MRNYLDYFFDHACLVRSSKTGMWALDKRDLSLLSRFGAVFDESAGEIEKFSAAREPWTEPLLTLTRVRSLDRRRNARKRLKM